MVAVRCTSPSSSRRSTSVSVRIGIDQALGCSERHHLADDAQVAYRAPAPVDLINEQPAGTRHPASSRTHNCAGLGGGRCGSHRPAGHGRRPRGDAEPESSGSYRAFGGRLQGYPRRVWHFIAGSPSGAGDAELAGADGASATALQPPPHLLTTLPAPAGGGRRGCHGHGGHGRRTVRRGAARGRPGASGQAGHPERRCLSPRPWRANVPGWRRRFGAAGRARRRRGRGVAAASDGQARGRAAERVVDGLRLARAATTCRRRAWDRQRVSPVVPPAGAEVVAAGTADRGDALGGVSAVTVPDCGGQSVSPPSQLARGCGGVQGERGSSARRGRCASVASSPASAPSNFTVKPEQPAEQKSAMTQPSRICPRQ